MGKNIIIFGADMSSSMHADKKNKLYLMLDEGPAQGLDDTNVTAAAKYITNFTHQGRNICIKSML